MVSYEFQNSSMVVVENGTTGSAEEPAVRRQSPLPAPLTEQGENITTRQHRATPLPRELPRTTEESMETNEASSGGDTTDVPVVRTNAPDDEISMKGTNTTANEDAHVGENGNGHRRTALPSVPSVSPDEEQSAPDSGGQRWADLRQEVKILKNKRLRLGSTESSEGARPQLSTNSSFADVFVNMVAFLCLRV